jgi:hypothetical protein
MESEITISHVAAAPPKALDAELVNKAADIIGKDPYTTRLLLTGKIPKIIASYPSMDEARSAARRLCALGLAAFVFSDTELRKPFSVNAGLRSIQPGKAEVTIVKKNGETQTLKAEEVFLILKGTREMISVTETTRTVRKLNIAGTLISGGIPMFRNVKEKVAGESEIEGFVRVYSRSSAEPVAEIQQNGFDYGFLGEKRALSSRENLNNTALLLREIFPRSIYDDTLAARTEVSEVDCRLVYFYLRAGEVDPPPACD